MHPTRLTPDLADRYGEPVATVTKYGEDRFPGLAKTLAAAPLLREAARLASAYFSYIDSGSDIGYIKLFGMADSLGWSGKNGVGEFVRDYMAAALKAAGVE